MKPHKNLEVWQKSFSLAIDLYRFTNRFPPEEKFGLTSQIRRAATSIPTNIAEGAARRSNKEFIYFLYIAVGSASELDTLLLFAKELKYGTAEEIDAFILRLEDISKMLFGLIKSVSNKL